MEQDPTVATLTDQEWRLVDEGFMPAARANASQGAPGTYGSLTGDQWTFALLQGAESEPDGLIAICNAPDGSVTSYAVTPSDRSVRRVHLSEDVPDLKWSFGGMFSDLKAAVADRDDEASLSEVLGYIGVQTEFGFDIPSGDDLRPLQGVIAEAAALYGAVAHAVGSIFSPTSE